MAILHCFENAMLSTSAPPATTIDLDLLNPIEVIEAMIDLRIQLEQIETQIDALKLAFYSACATLNAEKIERDRALIIRRLTSGQWTYSPEVLEQKLLFKQLKQRFHKAHEPTSGRESGQSNYCWRLLDCFRSRFGAIVDVCFKGDLLCI